MSKVKMSKEDEQYVQSHFARSQVQLYDLATKLIDLLVLSCSNNVDKLVSLDTPEQKIQQSLETLKAAVSTLKFIIDLSKFTAADADTELQLEQYANMLETLKSKLTNPD